MPVSQPFGVGQPTDMKAFVGKLSFLIDDIYSYIDELRGLGFRRSDETNLIAHNHTSDAQGGDYAFGDVTAAMVTYLNALMTAVANVANVLAVADVAGTAGRLTVTDDGDGTITLTVPLKAGYGIDSDAGGLKLKQQAHIADLSTTVLTMPADSPADADALRDDLVANALNEIQASLNAIETKVNAMLLANETAEIYAAS